jgi:hypothetical protein
MAMTAAAARTATAPRNVVGRPKSVASAAPLVTPIKKMGVTIPPLPLDSSVIEVARILSRTAGAATDAVSARTPLDRPGPEPA